MARKSGWQQFADNFNAVYGTFRDVAKEWESESIMKEKPVEVLDDMGEPVGWDYGGQRYDTALTADQLRGLQYTRLGDTLAKYGDVKGAMDLRLRAEDIQARRDQNKLFADTYDQLEKKVGLGNQATEADINYTNARTTGVGLTNQGQAIKNDIARETAPGQIAATNVQNNSAVVRAPSADEAAIAGSRADTADANIRTNTAGLRETAANARLQAGIGTDTRTINENKVWTDFAAKAAIPYGQEGGFKDDADARASLFSSLGKVNPLAAQELENNYATGELKHMMGMAAQNVEKANQALAQGGPEGLRQLIDDTNGINNAQWETNEKGVPTLWEITPDGQKVRPIASGSDVTEISASLQATLNPSTALNVAKQMYDNNKLQAEAEYYRSKALAERSGKGLTKEQWAMARLTQNPNDELAYAILLGAKYEPDQIPGLINKTGLQNAGAVVPDPNAARASAEGETSAEPPKTGLAAEVEDLTKNAETDTSGIGGHAKRNAERRKVEAQAKLDQLATPEGIDQLIAEVDAELEGWSKKTTSGHAGRTRSREMERLKTRREELLARKEALATGGPAD